MRGVTFDANRAAPQPVRWMVSRVLIASAVFTAPFVLLVIKLHAESINRKMPDSADSVLIRFAVVGFFACLMTRSCIAWMKRQR